ncbi:uncharacterized protein LOC123678058 isoform X2 [Harmonia axyridis]|uniref:uncharacterized protein LOC123678058 isoform X2 n=1 Tax=Harmonia axyridis TaxID=115357 RepID=UPI001E277CC7|nr:uncharacterized protein LOC123678058 isoform X2 [Harmonia axyridis]
MIRQCEICKKSKISHPDLSFHKFPSDTEKRGIWASLLGFESVNFTKKLVFICSNHFNPDDIEIRPNGKFLKPDVVPLPYHTTFEISNESSDTVSEQEVSRISPTTETMLFGVASNQFDVEALSKSSSSSSVTLTASECENELSKTIFVEPSSQNVPRKKRKRSYFGDLSSSDFSTPEKRRKSFHGIKKIVRKQKVRIHCLQNKVRRQRLRITSLKSLVSFLNEKFRLSEESEHTLLVKEEKEVFPDTPPISEVYIQEQNLQQQSKIPSQDSINEEFIKIEYLEESQLTKGDLPTEENMSELGFSTISISHEDGSFIEQYSSKRQKLNEAQEQPKKSSSELFLLSLVPHLESMTDHQQLSFQRQVIQLLEIIKYPQSDRPFS